MAVTHVAGHCFATIGVSRWLWLVNGDVLYATTKGRSFYHDDAIGDVGNFGRVPMAAETLRATPRTMGLTLLNATGVLPSAPHDPTTLMLAEPAGNGVFLGRDR